MLAGCGGNAGPLASASATDLKFVAAVATWDMNHDGTITCSEWKQYAAGLFKDADRDRDGILVRQEFEAMSRQDRLFATIGFAYFDADADGRITLPELTDKPNPAFTPARQERRLHHLTQRAPKPGERAPGREQARLGPYTEVPPPWRLLNLPSPAAHGTQAHPLRREQTRGVCRPGRMLNGRNTYRRRLTNGHGVGGPPTGSRPVIASAAASASACSLAGELSPSSCSM
jgi:Ca2+-binding EF-hand superfamily protein